MCVSVKYFFQFHGGNQHGRVPDLGVAAQGAELDIVCRERKPGIQRFKRHPRPPRRQSFRIDRRRFADGAIFDLRRNQRNEIEDSLHILEFDKCWKSIKSFKMQTSMTKQPERVVYRQNRSTTYYYAWNPSESSGDAYNLQLITCISIFWLKHPRGTTWTATQCKLVKFSKPFRPSGVRVHLPDLFVEGRSFNCHDALSTLEFATVQVCLPNWSCNVSKSHKSSSESIVFLMRTLVHLIWICICQRAQNRGSVFAFFH